jgi:hypothetical protein
MDRQFPTRIEATYSKPRDYMLKDVPTALWCYSLQFTDADVHGFAGGLLSKTSDGLWQAHYWNYRKVP